MVPIYATEAWWWAARPLWVLLWSGVFDRHPGLRFAITEDGAWWLPDIVERMDEKWVGGHNTRKFGNLFRDSIERKPSEYLGTNVFLGASTPESARDRRPATRIGVRHPALGQRLPPPRGHLAAHPRVDPRRVPRRPRRRDVPDARAHRRRGLPVRRRQARQHGRAHRPHPSKRSTDDRHEARLPRRGGADRQAPSGTASGLPMPRNQSLLDPSTPRLHVRTVTDRFPFPIPNGWFIVADVRRDRPRPGARRCTTSVATWCCSAPRPASPGVVDAYCPHLGAHLGVGGQVEGDCMRCPFHGWEFDGDSGACVEIPYGERERIPAKAHARAVPHHRTGRRRSGPGTTSTRASPSTSCPRCPRWTTPAWIRHAAAGVHDLDLVPGDGREQPRLRPLPVRARHRGHPRGRGGHRRHLQVGHEEPGRSSRETFGLGLGVLRVKGMLDLRVVGATPIDEDNVPRPLDLHRRRPSRARTSARVLRRAVHQRRHPGHPDLGEQDLPAASRPHQERVGHHRPPQLVEAVLQRPRRSLIASHRHR